MSVLGLLAVTGCMGWNAAWGGTPAGGSGT